MEWHRNLLGATHCTVAFDLENSRWSGIFYHCALPVLIFYFESSCSTLQWLFCGGIDKQPPRVSLGRLRCQVSLYNRSSAPEHSVSNKHLYNNEHPLASFNSSQRRLLFYRIQEWPCTYLLHIHHSFTDWTCLVKCLSCRYCLSHWLQALQTFSHNPKM